MSTSPQNPGLPTLSEDDVRWTSWWYSVPDSDSFSKELIALYGRSFSPDYRPSAFRGYSGAPWKDDQDVCEGDIVLLGDSTVATGLCHKLAEASSRQGSPHVFRDFSSIAANSGMALSSVVHKISARPAKAVVIVGGGIDILVPLRFDPRPGLPHIQLIWEIFYDHFYDRATRSIWHKSEPLCSQKLQELYFTRLAELRRSSGWMTQAWEHEIVETLVSNIKKTIIICSAFRLPVLYVLQPIIAFKKHLGAVETATFPSEDSASYIHRQFSTASRLLSEADIWTSRAALLDLHDLFRDEHEEMFADAIHCNEPGMERIAHTIITALHQLDWFSLDNR